MTPRILAALSEPLLVEEAALATIRAILDREDAAGLSRLAKPIEPEAVEARAGKAMDGGKRATVRDGVATIPVRGPIVRHASLFSELCGTATVAAISHDLNAALDSPTVRAIILEFDTPGGQVTGVGELAGMIFDARGTKPIVAFVDGAACSAGYYLASACDEVCMAPMARVGSVGAIVGIPASDTRPGRPIEFVSSQSPLKRVEPESEAGACHFQQMVDDLAAVFIADVARFRGTTEESVAADFGRGGTMLGDAAVRAGMADRCASYEQIHRELSGKAPRTSGASGAARMHDDEVTPMATKPGWTRVWGLFDSKGELKTVSEDAPVASDKLPPAMRTEGAPAGVQLVADENPAELTDTERAELVEIRAELVRLKAGPDAKATAKTLGDAFAETMLSGEKIVPAEVAGVSTLFERAALDDATYPVPGQPTHRQDAVRSIYASRPKHGLTAEQVPTESLPADAKVLPPVPGAAEPKATEPTADGATITPARKAHLLSLTDGGLAVLATLAK